MPGGVPVATFAIGEAGAKNAALHAAAILALGDEALAKRLGGLAQEARPTTSPKPPPTNERNHTRCSLRYHPGGTIGILGGGQLGRMLALAAARLGLKAHIYSDEADAPAFQVCGARTVAAYDDKSALAMFAATCDAITFEFENVPEATVAFLVRTKARSAPDARRLATTQDRLDRKDFWRKARPEDRAVLRRR